MTNQPEALRLADAIDKRTYTYGDLDKASDELRRLHALNQELLEALKLAKTIIGHPDDEASKHIASAIAKAEGKKQ